MRKNFTVEEKAKMEHFNKEGYTHSATDGKVGHRNMLIDFPSLLDHNINNCFNKTPERKMLRSVNDNILAFLSDHYRGLDNLRHAEGVFPIIAQMKGSVLVLSVVTYIKVINRNLKVEIDVVDIVQAGLVISNREVCLGSLKVELLLYRLV